VQQYPISLNMVVDRSQLDSLRSGLSLGNIRSAGCSWANAYAAAGKGVDGKLHK
jgi:hypothetical protein